MFFVLFGIFDALKFGSCSSLGFSGLCLFFFFLVIFVGAAQDELQLDWRRGAGTANEARADTAHEAHWDWNWIGLRPQEGERREEEGEEGYTTRD